MKIKHHFANEPTSISLFDKTTTFAQFKTKLTDMSKVLPIENPICWGRHIDKKENENVVLGDAFELFTELMVGCFGIYPSIGLDNYTPVNPGEEKVPLVFSRSAYGSDKKHMSMKQSVKHKYPCVHSMHKGNVPVFTWSSKPIDGVYAQPKVILNDGWTVYAIIDIEGRFGVGQQSFFVPVESEEEANIIKAAVESEDFKELIRSTKWGQQQTDWRMFADFRKDFWKEFI